MESYPFSKGRTTKGCNSIFLTFSTGYSQPRKVLRASYVKKTCVTWEHDFISSCGEPYWNHSKSWTMVNGSLLWVANFPDPKNKGKLRKSPSLPIDTRNSTLELLHEMYGSPRRGLMIKYLDVTLWIDISPIIKGTWGEFDDLHNWMCWMFCWKNCWVHPGTATFGLVLHVHFFVGAFAVRFRDGYIHQHLETKPFLSFEIFNGEGLTAFFAAFACNE